MQLPGGYEVACYIVANYCMALYTISKSLNPILHIRQRDSAGKALGR